MTAITFFSLLLLILNLIFERDIGMFAITAACLILSRLCAILQRSERNARERLRAADAAKESYRRLLCRISGEARPQLASIEEVADVLKDYGTDAALCGRLYPMRAAGYRLAAEMRNVRDFADLIGGDIGIQKAPYRVTGIFESILDEIRLMNDRGLDIVFDIDSAVPAELRGDGDKIVSILRALVTNSCRFTESGGVYVHMGRQERPYGINLLIEVEDTGCGMSGEEIDRVCAGFFPEKSGEERAADGPGLGLLIVRGLVRAMGGVMRIDSAKGEGTGVSVSIPQEVCDGESCLPLKCAVQPVPAGYLGFLTVPNPKVRDYYMRLITSLMKGWSMSFPRVTSLGDLKELLRTVKVTHLFVGTGEYRDNKAYLDALAASCHVALIRDADYEGEIGENITVIDKPFYAYQIAVFLGAGGSGEEVPEQEKPQEEDPVREAVPAPLDIMAEGGYAVPCCDTAEHRLAGIEGLNCGEGLSYCQDDWDFYLEVLAEYAKGYDKKVEELRDAFSQEDWKLYCIKVHAIKSTSKIIGAEDLSIKAQKLEKAASGADVRILEECHPDFLLTYESMVRKISDALGLREDRPEEVPVSADEGDLEQPAQKEPEVIDFFPVGGA
ncbi:MAG: HAMP domain-containing histidine kinase [Lachnospiraceae bacterium]|nr:HAMP domain-containing histidine kinase [Lachnospiraceae bacterium]